MTNEQEKMNTPEGAQSEELSSTELLGNPAETLTREKLVAYLSDRSCKSVGITAAVMSGAINPKQWAANSPLDAMQAEMLADYYAWMIPA